tara:strand:- start:9898 stop:10452 length:555 start_codon:yes stop_codon:yes gene_type:complete
MKTIHRIRTSNFNTPHKVIVRMRSGLLRAVVFALLWWILTQGNMESWLVGTPVVMLATLVSMALLPPFCWSLSGIVRFLPFFLWHSLRGGVDVGWRAFHPNVPINPALIDYPLCLPPGIVRVFMANIVNLLPGTLCAELNGNCLKVHALDTSKDVLLELMAVEQVVARIFSISLPCAKGEECNE